jgi:hypothetical protein
MALKTIEVERIDNSFRTLFIGGVRNHLMPKLMLKTNKNKLGHFLSKKKSR